MNEQAIPGDDDTLLSAYLDGELAAKDAGALTDRLAREPALMRRLEALRGNDETLRALYAEMDAKPLPAGVLDLLQSQDDVDQPATDNVLPFPQRTLRSFWQAPVAIAASLALAAGFLSSRLLPGDGAIATAPLYAQTVPADSPLFDLLENGHSRQTANLGDGSNGRVLLTFEDRSGDWCRQVAIDAAANRVQALACRREGHWQTETLAFALPQSGDYQPAGGATPAALDAAIDRLIGDNGPLDASAEAAIVERGWK